MRAILGACSMKTRTTIFFTPVCSLFVLNFFAETHVCIFSLVLEVEIKKDPKSDDVRRRESPPVDLECAEVLFLEEFTGEGHGSSNSSSW